jgi:hypothetical protein
VIYALSRLMALPAVLRKIEAVAVPLVREAQERPKAARVAAVDKAPLSTVILLSSRLVLREDGRSPAGTFAGRDGGQPVTGGVRGSARTAARRAPKGAKAELPVR